jgi:hypothetical protein
VLNIIMLSCIDNLYAYCRYARCSCAQCRGAMRLRCENLFTKSGFESKPIFFWKMEETLSTKTLNFLFPPSPPPFWYQCCKSFWGRNGKEATVNRALDGSTYPSLNLVHSVFGKINYGGLKHNSLYLGLVLPSGGWQSLIYTLM